MATITRADFAESLRTQFGFTATDAYKMVDIIFDEICESLINGDMVKVSGLGSFRILNKNARLGRNPKTGVTAIISPRRVAAFRPSAEFRARVAIK